MGAVSAECGARSRFDARRNEWEMRKWKKAHGDCSSKKLGSEQKVR